jgi:hypothetical protein
MNTSLITWHPVADALDGADLAFYVGFVVAGILYWVLRRSVADPAPAPALAAAETGSALGGPGE